MDFHALKGYTCKRQSGNTTQRRGIKRPNSNHGSGGKGSSHFGGSSGGSGSGSGSGGGKRTRFSRSAEAQPLALNVTLTPEQQLRALELRIQQDEYRRFGELMTLMDQRIMAALENTRESNRPKKIPIPASLKPYMSLPTALLIQLVSGLQNI